MQGTGRAEEVDGKGGVICKGTTDFSGEVTTNTEQANPVSFQ